jgi:hypothetical protein
MLREAGGSEEFGGENWPNADSKINVDLSFWREMGAKCAPSRRLRALFARKTTPQKRRFFY